MRGIGCGLDRGVFCGNPIGVACRWESDARARHRGAQGRRGLPLKTFNDEKNKDFRDRDLYVYCFSLPEGNITAYQSPVMIGTNVKDLKIPPNNPVGQRAYDAVAKAAEGEIVSFTYDFPRPGTKASAPKETLEACIGKQGMRRQLFQDVGPAASIVPKRPMRQPAV